MKNSNTIRIKNELPELLEAVCEHPDCPEWLKHDIWDSFSEWASGPIIYNAAYWRSYLDHCWKPDCDNAVEYGRLCAECLKEKAEEVYQRAAMRNEGEWPEVVQ